MSGIVVGVDVRRPAALRSSTSHSGNFHANSGWLQCAALAHHLIRWTTMLGQVRVDDQLIVSRTARVTERNGSRPRLSGLFALRRGKWPRWFQLGAPVWSRTHAVTFTPAFHAAGWSPSQRFRSAA